MLDIPDDVEIHEFPTSKFWIKNGIVYSVSMNRKTTSVKEAKAVMDDFRKIVGNEKICLIIDVSNTTESPREVRDYAAEEFPKFVKAIAMISDSALGKMIANLFFTVKHQPYPTRFFNDVSEAEKWLQQFQ